MGFHGRECCPWRGRDDPARCRATADAAARRDGRSLPSCRPGRHRLLYPRPRRRYRPRREFSDQHAGLGHPLSRGRYQKLVARQACSGRSAMGVGYQLVRASRHIGDDPRAYRKSAGLRSRAARRPAIRAAAVRALWPSGLLACRACVQFMCSACRARGGHVVQFVGEIMQPCISSCRARASGRSSWCGGSA